ncbi:MAG: porin family protein [Paracoccaceae bacterium]|nr:porin family protein [Paracoccaceae bacterium]
MRFPMLSAAAILAASSVTASAQDWTGFYAGLSVSSHGSDLSQPGVPFDFSASGVSPGIFAGYSFLVGSNTILGGEISYDAYDQNFFPGFPLETGGMFQARARLGYAMGNAMPYAAIGAASARMNLIGSPTETETGWSVGLGLDYMVATDVSVRAEYTFTRFDDVLSPTYLPPGFDVTDQALSIGVAMHF